MKYQKLIVAAMVAVTVIGTTLTLSITSNAQGGPGGPSQQVGPPPGQGGPGFPAQAGPRNPGAPPGAPFGGPDAPAQFRQGGGQFGAGGGGTAMDSDNSFLYIVQGNMLYKVSKGDLRIQGSTPLMQMPQGAPGAGRFAPGQPGARPPGGSGGGTIPPPEKE